MNKKRVFIILIIIVLNILSCILLYNKKKNMTFDQPLNSHSTLAIYKQQIDGDNNSYVKTDTFPSDGYRIDRSLSRCYRDNNIEDDDWDGYKLLFFNKRVIYKANQESHCKLYFSIDKTAPEGGSLTLKSKDPTVGDGYTYDREIIAKITWEDDDVAYYCISSSSTSCDNEFKALTFEQNEKMSLDTNYTLGGICTGDNFNGPCMRYLFLKDDAGNISENPIVGKIIYSKFDVECKFLLFNCKSNNNPRDEWCINNGNNTPRLELRTPNESGDAYPYDHEHISKYGIGSENTEDKYNGKWLIELTNTDDSGVEYYGYIKEEGGHEHSCKSDLVKIDLIVPKIDSFAIGGSGDPDYIQSNETIIYMTWGDSDVTQYCINTDNNPNRCNWKNVSDFNNNQVAYTIDYDPDNDPNYGIIQLYGYIKDRAGNISQFATDDTTIDTTKPAAIIEAKKETSLEVVPSGKPSNEKLKFKINGTTESAGGLAKAYYCIGNNCTPNIEKNINESFTVDSIEAYKLRYRVKGTNGQLSEILDYIARFDTSRPNISLFAIGGSSNPGYIANNITTTYISWTDVESNTVSRINNFCVLTENDVTKCNWIGVGDVSREKGYLNESYMLSNGAGEKTLYAFIRDEAGNISPVAIDSVVLDESLPIVSLTSTSTLKSDLQTATLKCDDESGIKAYYWGTNAPSNAASVSTTTAADLQALTNGEGLKKTINSAGTYYFACKDNVGRISSVSSITYNSYKVDNRLITVDGNKDSYTSSDYARVGSVQTYIAPNGTVLTLSSTYTVPGHSNTNKFRGYSLGSASSTSANPKKANPTLSENNKTYTMWFMRNMINIKIKVLSGEELIDGDYGNYIWTKDSDGYVVKSTTSGSSSNTVSSLRYGVTSINLWDNNPAGHFAILKEDNVPTSGSEWECVSGCASGVSTLTQDERTLTNTDTQLCNTSTNDCTIVLKVKWKSYTKDPTCKLKVNSSNKIVFDSKSDDYRIIGYDLTSSKTASFNGNTSLSLAAGTFYGHVKNQAKHTSRCSITISSGSYVKKSKKCVREKTYSWVKDNGSLTTVTTCSPQEKTCNYANRGVERRRCLNICRRAAKYRCYCYINGNPANYEYFDNVNSSSACSSICSSAQYNNVYEFSPVCSSNEIKVESGGKAYCYVYPVGTDCPSGYTATGKKQEYYEVCTESSSYSYYYKNNSDSTVSSCTVSSSIPSNCTSSNKDKTYVTACNFTCPSGSRIGSTAFCK
jgi:hypothetical protein